MAEIDKGSTEAKPSHGKFSDGDNYFSLSKRRTTSPNQGLIHHPNIAFGPYNHGRHGRGGIGNLAIAVGYNRYKDDIVLISVLIIFDNSIYNSSLSKLFNKKNITLNIKKGEK